MIILDSTTQTLELLSTSTASTDYYVAYADITTTTLIPGQSNGNITTATTTTILAAPSASTQRQVKAVSIRNRATTASQGVTIKFDDSGTERYLTSDITLAAGETLQYSSDLGWTVKDRNGREKVLSVDTVGFSGFTMDIYKLGTAAEAAGQWYGFAKDGGFPGAWVPGAPGVNGWWTDASVATNAANPAGAAQVGAFQLPNPASGTYYALAPNITTSVAHLAFLWDLIWYNTGIAPTTVGAQAIAQPGASIPARDLDGTTNGRGWNAGLYITTATTNAGVINNTTFSYTNSDGTAGRVGTLSPFPATAVAGTFVPFQLQAGDQGVRSIQSVTLGTTYGGGALSVVMYRTLYSIPNTIINVGGTGSAYTTEPTGIKIFNGTAFWWVYRASTTTATSISGSFQIVER